MKGFPFSTSLTKQCMTKKNSQMIPTFLAGVEFMCPRRKSDQSTLNFQQVVFGSLLPIQKPLYRSHLLDGAIPMAAFQVPYTRRNFLQKQPGSSSLNCSPLKTQTPKSSTNTFSRIVLGRWVKNATKAKLKKLGGKSTCLF